SAPGGKGAVYLYRKVQGRWKLWHTLHGESQRSEFGKSLTGEGSALFVGSPSKNNGKAAVVGIGAPGEDKVYMYQQKADESWALHHKIQGAKYSRFGDALAMRKYNP